MEREALKLALKVLEDLPGFRADIDNAITAIKEALAQPEQEPVAHQFQTKDGTWYSFIGQPHYETVLEEGHLPIRALYTTPPQRTWVGLTDKERSGIEDYCEMIIGKAAFDAIEAKLKEKNNAA